jgi:tetratricopeptide (TPR) repeat protein
MARHVLAYYRFSVEKDVDGAAHDVIQQLIEAHAEPNFDAADLLEMRADLAQMMARQGHSAAAKDELAAVITEANEILGPQHPHVAMFVRNLVSVSMWEHDIDNTIRLLRAELSHGVSMLGPRNPVTLATRRRLGQVLNEGGQYAVAADLLGQGLGDQIEVLGSEHLSTLAMLHNMAFAFSRCGRTREALDAYRQVLAAQVRQLGLEHDYTQGTLRGLKQVVDQVEDHALAVEALGDLLTLDLAVTGRDGQASLRLKLAHHLCCCGDVDSAIEEFTTVVEMVPPTDPTWPKAAVELISLMHRRSALGDADTVADLRQRLVERRTPAFLSRWCQKVSSDTGTHGAEGDRVSLPASAAGEIRTFANLPPLKSGGFKLNDRFLEEVGLGDLPSPKRSAFLHQAYAELEERIGSRLTANMRSALLDEFGLFVDRREAEMRQWLSAHQADWAECKTYQDMVRANPDAKEVDLMSEYGAMLWLALTRPDYADVVGDEWSQLSYEIASRANDILDIAAGGSQAQQ